MAMLQRRGSPPLVFVSGVALLCAIFGIVAGVSPVDAILAMCGIAFVTVVFTNLTLGVAIFAALSFLDTLTTGGASGSFDKLAGLLLFVSWLLDRATAQRTSARDIVRENTPLFVWLGLYMTWSVISLVWATDTGAVVQQVYRYALDMLLIPIVYAAVRSRRDLHTIIVGYFIGAGFSVIYGLARPTSTSSSAGGRLVGSLGEANQSATVLVAGLALAAGMWLATRRSPRLRLLAVSVSSLAVIGLVSTVSRAGLIALGTVLVCGMFIGGRWRKPAIALTLIGAVALPVYFFALAPARITNRVTNSQTSGRNDIWLVAWRAFSAHPVLGVGAGNFQSVSRDYVERPGFIQSGYILNADKVVHNIYLEQLAQLGVPGLIALIAVFVSVIIAGLRAAHIFERRGDSEMELLSRCWILALAAFLAADFFASELTSKQLWLVFALGPALLKLARNERSGVPA